MFEERLVELSVDMKIQHPSSNYKEYQACGTFVILKN